MTEKKQTYLERVTDETLDLFYPTMKNTSKKTTQHIKGHPIQTATASPKPVGLGVLASDVIKSQPVSFKDNSSYKPMHNVYKELSIDCYKDYSNKNIAGFQRIYEDSNKQSGFYAAAYVNPETKNIVAAFRGTEIPKSNDIKNDLAMGMKDHLPHQFYDAEKFYSNLKNKLGDKFKDFKIDFTGHSLGGSIAELMGAKYGNETVTFNAYGVGHIKNAQINYKDNITNYGNTEDFVYNAQGSDHIGKTIYTAVESQQNNKARTSIKYHFIENMGDITKTPNNVKEKSSGGGTVHVSAYTRGDGTDVSSYTRSAPHR